MALRYIDSLELAGRRTFIRADFNVPLEDGVITDATRIEASLPTIQYAWVWDDATLAAAWALAAWAAP